VSALMLNTCPVCGAEESLDVLLHRMIDDDQVRHLIAQVITTSFPMGGLVIRYLRLFKPAKQRLRMATIGKLLAELVPDVQRSVIERKGRHWAVTGDNWTAAFQGVFDAADKGTLTLPLEGNGYLYGVLMRIAERQAAAGEAEQEQAKRGRASEAGAKTVAALIELAIPREAVPAGPKTDSPTVRRMKAETAAKQARTTPITNEEGNPE